MKLSTAVAISFVLAASIRSVQSAEPQNQFEMGQTDYNAGEFKPAVRHFERAAQANPADARVYFWLGKSYENLALIGGPLASGHAESKAYVSLSKAVALAPADREYLRELFNFLLDSDSRHSLHEAWNLLQTVNEADPDYPFMLIRFHEASADRRSPDAVTALAFTAAPRQLVTSMAAVPGPRRTPE